MSSRANKTIARWLTYLIMIPITYLIHFTVHAFKVHGPRLIQTIKKRR